MSLGNHEFDLGIGGLTPFIENLTSPVLAANLDLAKVPELARESNLKKSITLDVNGHTVGIIGYLTPETKLVAIANDVEYIDEVVALKEEVKKMQNDGIQIIIALGHSGFQKDRQIAKEVEGIDLVIGGHTNTFLWNGTSPDSEKPQGNYPTYVKQKSGKLVPVVQAYAYTKYLGRLHMIFNNKSELLSIDGSPILLDKNIPQDEDVLKIIHKYRDNVVNTADEVIGHSSVVLDGTTCLSEECNIGNLITDAMVFQYALNYSGEHWTDAPIAIIQGGGIRSSVSHEGMPIIITKGDLLEVMPFVGDLAAVTMNGTVLLRALEHSVAKYDRTELSGTFLQFSGIKVIYDLSKPSGSRVVKAEARCWACDVPKYFKIRNKEMYKVLMPSFLAEGGDGFLMFKSLPVDTLDYSELLATQNYVARHSPIYAQVEGKITLLNDITVPDEISACSFISLSKLAALISVFILVLS